MYNSTGLISSIIKDDFDLVISIIESGIDLNFPEGDLPLASAVAFSRANIVKLLLEKGATPFDSIMLQLQIESSENNIQILSLLANVGVNLNYKMEDDDTFLMIVSIRGEIDLVKHLVELGADVNQVNRDGDSALMNAGFYAKRTGNWDIFAYLEPFTNLDLRFEANECLKDRRDLSKIDPLVEELSDAVCYNELKKYSVVSSREWILMPLENQGMQHYTSQLIGVKYLLLER